VLPVLSVAVLIWPRAKSSKLAKLMEPRAERFSDWARSSRRTCAPQRQVWRPAPKGAIRETLSKTSIVLLVRPCGKLALAPSAANPPPIAMLGSPAFRGTPGRAAPPASVNIVPASKPASRTWRCCENRDSPRRSSLIDRAEKVCCSEIAAETWEMGP